MRICVFAAGAIGGVFAVRLAMAGHEVSVVTRAAVAETICKRGLILQFEGSRYIVRLPASENAAVLGPQDLVLCTAKAHSVPSVACGIGSLLKADTPIVFVQNGIPWWYFHRYAGPLEDLPVRKVDPDGEIRRLVAPQRVLGCVTYLSATAEAGLITQYSGGYRARTILGEPNGAASDRLAAAAEALSVVGVAVLTTNRIRAEIFTKLIGNAAMNSLCALTRSSVDVVAGDPRLEELLEALMDECRQVGAALGAAVDIDTAGLITGYRGMVGVKPSTLQDLEAGRDLEIDALLGAVSELGRLAGVPTPAVDRIYALLFRLAASSGIYPATGRYKPI